MAAHPLDPRLARQAAEFLSESAEFVVVSRDTHRYVNLKLTFCPHTLNACDHHKLVTVANRSPNLALIQDCIKSLLQLPDVKQAQMFAQELQQASATVSDAQEHLAVLVKKVANMLPFTDDGGISPKLNDPRSITAVSKMAFNLHCWDFNSF